jgi:hypothetical protein
MPTTTTRTAHDVRRRATAALVAILLTAAAALVALPAPRAAGADDRAKHWSGFRIPRTGHAAGGWIGGYRVGDTPVFVVTPGRRPNRKGFRPSRATADLRGPKGPSAAATERAAWILSKYGGHKDAVQAAAVDASVLHLLGGRAWRFGARRGAARIRATGDPATVRRYVRLMLRGSRTSAGPYAVAVTATTADVGGVTGVTVSVTDGHGGPVAGLPVRVTSPDGGPSQPAGGPVDTVTGDDGRALVRLAAPLAGWRTVVAEVGQVPLHWLRLRRADRKRQASAAEGGVRRTIVASARVAVRGPQTLTLAPVPSSLTLGAQARVTATVSGDGSGRGASAGLFGPFASASAAACTGSPVAGVSMALPGDGTHTLPPVVPAAGGYYAWRVDVEGTPTSIPAASCGAVVKVRGRSGVSVSAPPAAATFDPVDASVTLSGLPFGGPVDVTTRLYGPFGSLTQATCTGSHQIVTQRRPGNGVFKTLSFAVNEPGWYTWRTSVPEGDLWEGAESACGVVGTVTQVSP